MSALDFRRLGSEQASDDRAGEHVPEMVALQAVAIVDHVCSVNEAQLQDAVGGQETGGSIRVEIEAVSAILASVGEFHSKAGGSAANVLRYMTCLCLRTKAWAAFIEMMVGS